MYVRSASGLPPVTCEVKITYLCTYAYNNKTLSRENAKQLKNLPKQVFLYFEPWTNLGELECKKTYISGVFWYRTCDLVLLVQLG
jgi:hypothetical protein